MEYLQGDPENEPLRAWADPVDDAVADAVAAAVTQLNYVLPEASSRAFKSLRDYTAKLLTPITDEIAKNILARNSRGATSALRALGVATADVEEDCDQLINQVRFDSFGGALYCLKLRNGTSVPVSDSQRHLLIDDQNLINFPSLQTEPIQKAVQNFCGELKAFLAQRLAIGNLFAPPVPPANLNAQPPRTLPVRVFSQTTGARVSYSPAYFIHYVVLGSPTSPAVGTLLPGRYIFQITSSQTKTFDPGVFDIPPQFDVNLVV